MIARVASLLLVVVALAACEDSHLEQLHPAIAVCPEANAPIDQCDRPLDLGDIAVTVPVDVSLLVRDVGGATLDIAKATSSEADVVVDKFPSEVFSGREKPISLTVQLPVTALGAHTAELVVDSNDPKDAEHVVHLLWRGVPKPAPKIELCNDDESACGVDIAASFGTVRRTQTQGLEIVVKNTGTAVLDVSEVSLTGSTSVTGEIAFLTSTRPAKLQPGQQAPLVLSYTPADGVADAVTLVVTSDDPDHPRATAALTGDAAANEAPTASAVEEISQATSTTVIVDDTVQCDGSASSDPEGDPLVYAWHLDGPTGSAADLDDATSVKPTFTPDVPGVYTATLTVADSLGQNSAPAQVVVTARPRFALSASLSWTDGGDLDLHVLPQGASLFTSVDCDFENRDVDFGATPGVVDDDCQLLDDATSPPGGERAVIIAPAAGTYELWVNVFDDGGIAAIPATLTVTLNDAAAPSMIQSRQLPGNCAAWHVADITYPGAMINVLDAAIGTQCRP